MPDNPVKSTGGISFRAPTFSFNTGEVTGGLQFDLPLATVASFQNTALSFQRNNTQNTQGFLSNLIQRSQNQVTQTADTAFGLQNRALASFNEMSRQQRGVLDRSIEASKPKGGCFITTAWAKTVGGEFYDECHELQVLRKFRDNYMLANADKYGDMIAQYYREAPEIVAAIDDHIDSTDIYLMLGNDYIKPAVRAIENGHNAIAIEIYTDMFLIAKRFADIK